MIPQVPVVFDGVSLVLVVMTIKALIAPHGISYHLILPFEERLILNFSNTWHTGSWNIELIA